MYDNNKTKNILGLTKPVFGLSPMDGVTDAANRFIIKKYGNPDLIFTEFTHVHGLCVAAENMLTHFDYSELERPVIGQIYGHEPEYFYHAAKIVVALGFDSVDINMGCPAKKVSMRGAGAGLIRTPDLAREIIAEVKRGVADWVSDGKLTGLKAKAQKAVEAMIERNKARITKGDIEKWLAAVSDQLSDMGHETWDLRSLEYKTPLGILNLIDRRHESLIREIEQSSNQKISNLTPHISHRFHIPVSVKTRTGYDDPITESWIKNLDSAKPDWISVHGRTLKQLYSGKADREEIRKAVESTDLPVLANGDIDSYEDALAMMEQTGAFGVLIGQGTYGNPWVFKKLEMRNEELGISPLLLGEDSRRPGEVLIRTILNVMLEHATLFDELRNHDERAFVQLRKHFSWYWTLINKLSTEQVPNSKEIRMKLVGCKSLVQLEEIIESTLS